MGRGSSRGLADYNVTSPAPRPVWEAVVDADPTTFVYQTPAALDALCVAYGVEDASRLYEFEDGQRLVLPMYRTARARVRWRSRRRRGPAASWPRSR